MPGRRHLVTLRKDPTMASVIDAVDSLPAYYAERSDFETAGRIIVGQQLSYKAASAIWQRVQMSCGRWTPQNVVRFGAKRLRASGLSGSKACFILDIAEAVATKRLSFSRIRKMPDDAAATALSELRGFGPWSVEMFMIFAMEREDVFSSGDAGLRRAICKLYGIQKHTYDKRVEAVTDKWRPFRSYACRYLWAWLDGK